jgi:hypothetical protein
MPICIIYLYFEDVFVFELIVGSNKESCGVRISLTDLPLLLKKNIICSVNVLSNHHMKTGKRAFLNALLETDKFGNEDLCANNSSLFPNSQKYELCLGDGKFQSNFLLP